MNYENFKKIFAELKYIKKCYENYICDIELLGEMEKQIVIELQEELKNKIDYMQKIADRIDDTYIKAIFCYRYIYCYSWTKISALFGGYSTEDCHRKALERFLRRFLPGGA